jgi:hypothetical protein
MIIQCRLHMHLTPFSQSTAHLHVTDYFKYKMSAKNEALRFKNFPVSVQILGEGRGVVHDYVF